jgi:polyhydroxyalkanoate synthesis repressor PhaR
MAKELITIKKYANRRLYNTATSAYVTLDDLAEMVKKGDDFAVFDAKSNEEITRSILSQIIFEQENKEGQSLLPVNFLRQVIKYYGDQMQMVVPSFLDMSMDNFVKEQDKIRENMTKSFGVGMMTTPFNPFDDQIKSTMAMFEQSMAMFNPFAPKPAEKPATELEILKKQMEDIQKKLEKLG